LVLSQSLQAVVEAMHMSKAQIHQALRQMRRVWVDTNISPWYKVFAFLPTLLSQRDGKQYPISPCETARIMYSVPLAMHSWSPAV